MSEASVLVAGPGAAKPGFCPATRCRGAAWHNVFVFLTHHVKQKGAGAVLLTCMKWIGVFLLVAGPALAQQRVTLNGYVKDKANGEALIGATVFIKEANAGSVTNLYGFFSISVPPGTYGVSASYVGYKPQFSTVTLSQNQRMDFELESAAEELEEVVITAELEQANVRNMEMSTNKLDMKLIQKLPAFLGEVDVLRSIQFLPGVSTVGEGASGFNVRGGSVGQNLVLLDEAPVYNTSHLFGFFSIFNPDAVKDVKLYKGAVPARYGGRLASILDVRMKEGNIKEPEVSGGIGTVFSRLAIEAPIIKDKASFIVAARRSYIDILARPFVDILQEGGALNFYDLTAKVNYNIDKKNRVFLSGYSGRDRFLFDANQGFSWGNATATARWNRLFNERLFSNLTFVYSKYDYRLQFGDDNLNRFNWNSTISNFIFKPEFTYYANSKNELNFGLEAIYYTFEPANAVGITNGNTIDISLDRKYNLETSAFIGNTQKVSDKVSFEYGLRFTNFQYFGPGNAYTFRDTIPGLRRPVASATRFGRGESIANYNSLQPRFSFRYQPNSVSSIKGSYNRMAQFLHLISNTTASNPLDVWTPTTQNIRPQVADQFTLGYFRDFQGKQQWEFSVEGYFRYAQNQVDFIDGADLLINRFLEGDLLSGRGRAYGTEFYLQKKTGKVNGWISYTVGRTELQVNGINRNEWYPTRFDQLHNLKIAAFYDITPRWSVSANFTFTSGTPVTFPTSRFTQQGILIPFNANDSRNNLRLPDYHRLDISFRLDGAKVRGGRQRKNRDYWVFAFYNVYARRNPFSIYFAQGEGRVPAGQAVDSQATQLAIIGTIVPSVSYNFKF